MIERLVIVLVVALAVLVISLLVRRDAVGRVSRVTGRPLSPALRAVLGPHDSGILYFYGPHCSTCARQASLLESLQVRDIPIIRLDATAEREVAAELSIMTVPSTAIVGRGRVVALNFGFAARETLLRQIHGL